MNECPAWLCSCLPVSVSALFYLCSCPCRVSAPVLSLLLSLSCLCSCPISVPVLSLLIPCLCSFPYSVSSPVLSLPLSYLYSCPYPVSTLDLSLLLLILSLSCSPFVQHASHAHSQCSWPALPCASGAAAGGAETSPRLFHPIRDTTERLHPPLHELTHSPAANSRGLSMASPLCSLISLSLLLLPFVTTTSFKSENLIIQTKDGKVRGVLQPVLDGHVREFLGIPYAKPPVGPLRFKPPQPADKWETVLDAASYPNSCYQMNEMTIAGFEGVDMWNANTPLSEDCLYLNVWSPVVTSGFSSGTSSLPLYDGIYLSKSENVVVVSMNYRLGALGFLSLPDSPIKGNFGLMDQQLALRWVADNIAAFGGDPSKVTIFGESAGSGSVGFHLLSPGSKDLFQRAVMQSGSPNAPWGTNSNDKAWANSKALVQKLGCPLSPSAKTESCLQKVKVDDFNMLQYAVVSMSFMNLPYGPVVDGTFLPLPVQDMLNHKDLPKKDVIFGLNQDEGTYFMMYGIPGFNLSGESLMTRAQFIQSMDIVLPDPVKALKETVIAHYTDWSDQYNETKNRDSIANVIADYMFVCPVSDFMQKYSARGAKTFLYWFGHHSSVNPWPEWMGAMHGYEIEFVFGLPLNASLKYTNKEVNMTRRFMKHWANFAKTGNPSTENVNWPQYTLDKMEYITLNTNDPEIGTHLRVRDCRIWNTVVPEILKLSDNLMPCSFGNVLRSNLLLSFLLLVTSVIFQL
ncbi:hypothetical protein WMY93_014455 [Mugilogobius chulae]|uniref:Cholinesterase n=1 Tax=Mugilogobius chulae TaxID=88201 RepID=A0AAW0NZ24_9GOBI